METKPLPELQNYSVPPAATNDFSDVVWDLTSDDARETASSWMG